MTFSKSDSPGPTLRGSYSDEGAWVTPLLSHKGKLAKWNSAIMPPSFETWRIWVFLETLLDGFLKQSSPFHPSPPGMGRILYPAEHNGARACRGQCGRGRKYKKIKSPKVALWAAGFGYLPPESQNMAFNKRNAQ